MDLRKKLDEEGVSPVIAIILMVAITVVLAGVLYVWVTSLADTGGTVENLRLDGEVYTDESGQVTKIMLEHRGGDKITWSDYKVTIGGVELTAPKASSDNSSATTAEVGQTTQWWDTTTARTVGTDYTIKVIDIETDTIVWEKTLTAKTFQTP